MSESKMISIIIPVYNGEKNLSRCVSSVLAQRYQNLQIILVNDGSTDRSAEICEEFSVEDRRVVVHHTENRGLVAARKFGMKMANAYIGFVDADDYIEPNMFEELLRTIVQADADFVHSGYVEEENGMEKKVCNFESKIVELPDMTDKIEFLKNYIINEVNGQNLSSSIWSKLFRADFIKNCYGKLAEEQQYGEDLLCLCRCVLECRRIALCGQTAYHYVLHNNSLSHLRYDDSMMKEIGLWNQIIKTLEEYHVLDKLKESAYGYLKLRMLYVIQRDERKKAPFPHFYIKDMEPWIGKSIVIFGAGEVGQDYYSQISRYEDCQIAAWVDSNYRKYEFTYARVKSTESVSTVSYDVIIIAVRDEKTGMDIRKSLIQRGVTEQKIFWEKPGEYF
ncbi:MAG: glycosyltransferase [Dorea sp.]|nr:glycosyltransferase [Dorea sp.]